MSSTVGANALNPPFPAPILISEDVYGKSINGHIMHDFDYSGHVPRVFSVDDTTCVAVWAQAGVDGRDFRTNEPIVPNDCYILARVLKLTNGVLVPGPAVVVVTAVQMTSVCDLNTGIGFSDLGACVVGCGWGLGSSYLGSPIGSRTSDAEDYSLLVSYKIVGNTLVEVQRHLLGGLLQTRGEQFLGLARIPGRNALVYAHLRQYVWPLVGDPHDPATYYSNIFTQVVNVNSDGTMSFGTECSLSTDTPQTRNTLICISSNYGVFGYEYQTFLAFKISGDVIIPLTNTVSRTNFYGFSYLYYETPVFTAEGTSAQQADPSVLTGVNAAYESAPNMFPYDAETLQIAVQVGPTVSFNPDFQYFPYDMINAALWRFEPENKRFIVTNVYDGTGIYSNVGFGLNDSGQGWYELACIDRELTVVFISLDINIPYNRAPFKTLGFVKNLFQSTDPFYNDWSQGIYQTLLINQNQENYGPYSSLGIAKMGDYWVVVFLAHWHVPVVPRETYNDGLSYYDYYLDLRTFAGLIIPELPNLTAAPDHKHVEYHRGIIH